MAVVATNQTSFSFAIEETENLGQGNGLGVLPASPEWVELQPDEIPSFGRENTTTQRNPISKNRQPLEPILTDGDVSAEINSDLTVSSFQNFIEATFFSRGTNSDLIFRAADATSTGYAIEEATPSQASKLQYTLGGPISLVRASNYSGQGNSGIKELSADVLVSDTEIQVAGLSAEAAPRNSSVEVAGIRAETGDLAISVVGDSATLSSGNNGSSNPLDFSTLGLSVGQFIHVGGVALSNQLSGSLGFGRVRGISPSTLTLDSLSSGLVTASGSGDTVDLLFGNFIRNVASDHPNYLERSFQFEAVLSGLSKPYMYVSGAIPASLSMEFPQTDKATMGVSFIAKDEEALTDTRKTNASNALFPVDTSAFATSSGFQRISIKDEAGNALANDFTSVSITVETGASASKVLNTLGAKFINIGSFSIPIEMTLLLSSSELRNSINKNKTVSIEVFAENNDGGIFLDIPSAKIEGSSPSFTKDEQVTVDVTASAFINNILGYTASFSTFSVLP